MIVDFVLLYLFLFCRFALFVGDTPYISLLCLSVFLLAGTRHSFLVFLFTYSLAWFSHVSTLGYRVDVL